MTISKKFKSLFEAKKALNDFLRENPHLKEMQESIEKEMAKLAESDHEGKMKFFRDKMSEKLADLNKNLKELRELDGELQTLSSELTTGKNDQLH